MSIIRHVLAREIWDSSGFSTIEIDLFTDHGLYRASVPSATRQDIRSDSSECSELSNISCYNSSIVVDTVNYKLTPLLIGQNITQQHAIDKILSELDLSISQKALGVNLPMAISMAVARGAASEKGIPLYRHISDMMENPAIRLPVPIINVINGGLPVANELPFREFQIAPVGASSFHEGIRIGSEISQIIKRKIKEQYGLEWTNVNEKGGFVPPLRTEEEALTMITEAIKESGNDGIVKIFIVVGADDFYNKSRNLYYLGYKRKKKTGEEEGDEENNEEMKEETNEMKEEANETNEEMAESKIEDDEREISHEEKEIDADASEVNAENISEMNGDTAFPLGSDSASASASASASTSSSSTASSSQLPSNTENEKGSKHRWVLNQMELVAYYVSLVRRYPIASLSDAFASEDVEGYLQLSDAMHRVERQKPTREEEEEEIRKRKQKEAEERQRRAEEEMKRKQEEAERLAREEEERKKKEEEAAALAAAEGKTKKGKRKAKEEKEATKEKKGGKGKEKEKEKEEEVKINVPSFDPTDFMDSKFQVMSDVIASSCAANAEGDSETLTAAIVEAESNSDEEVITEKAVRMAGKMKVEKWMETMETQWEKDSAEQKELREEYEDIDKKVIELTIPKAVPMKAANTVLFRMEQMKTVTEAVATARAAMKRGWSVCVAGSEGSESKRGRLEKIPIVNQEGSDLASTKGEEGGEREGEGEEGEEEKNELQEDVEGVNFGFELGEEEIWVGGGNTEDTFLADFAVGIGSGQVMFGGANRGENVLKYNQLLRIEEEMNEVNTQLNRMIELQNKILPKKGKYKERPLEKVVYSLEKWNQSDFSLEQR
ncbi:putative enolase [Monocercomonoides exilis]|uniref:putative enolase n=1 Tax=Monocercomonoides exilis TaxID=2049356 RepID=UPI00355A8AC8|nr:putative enolase [Monocercomonoides exilis]